MKKIMIPLAAAVLGGCCSLCCNDKKCGCDDPVMGNWGARLPFAEMNSGHLIFERGDDGAAKAVVLLRWGSPVPCTEVKVDGNEFSFYHPYGYFVKGRVCGEKMYGELAVWDGKKLTTPLERFQAWKNPPIKPASTKDAKLGEPIDLLKDGLDGWKAMETTGKFGWKFKDGVLSNTLGLKPDGSWAGGGINLMSKRCDFYDFNLEYDVRVPKNSNSGVYLRGRYECQVIDSYGKKVDEHNMAAYYGRVCPKVAAEKKPGEWQHVSVTLYKRHITVVLNGTTIIEDAPVVGITGGAIDACEFVPGPIYLQGDHSDADYKNMILRPAL